MSPVTHSADLGLFAVGAANLSVVKKRPLFTCKLTIYLTNSRSLVDSKRELEFKNHVLWLAV